MWELFSMVYLSRGHNPFRLASLRRVASTVSFFIALFLSLRGSVFAQDAPSAAPQAYFIDCSAGQSGDGSRTHPWNNLAAAQSHPFAPGDRIALARGSTCRGSFSPQGSGTEANPVRLTAYGEGARPKIIAAAGDRQVLLLFNQEYWQIDSLDLSGSTTYGIFISGDKGALHHIWLKNLYVHDVSGGAMKNKDNGLVIVGPSGRDVTFNDVLLDGVVAAHTSEWAGILIGGGNFGMDAPQNRHIVVRNSSVHDVYGDGIVLFRDSDGLIETSTAWETGMQPTQTIGTPNAIWTWTCTDCAVRDNEAFLTDSPGVDGGAYDIDWNNTRNVVERNYAHDTQGYCIAVFAAGYVTSDSVVRDNLCIDNALSPRLAALQGAVYLHTWNDGVIRGLRVENNTLVWNPPVSTAAAIVDDANAGDVPIAFTGNRIQSSANHFYLANAQFAPVANVYQFNGTGDARFSLGDRRDVTLAALQLVGQEKGSTIEKGPAPEKRETFLRLDATVDFILDADGLLSSASRAQLMVLRSLAAQYSAGAINVTVHLREPASSTPEQLTGQANALLDLDAPQIHFAHDGKTAGIIQLFTADGRLLKEWNGFQNAAALGGAVRAYLGAPRYAAMGDEP
jgi:Right handed beta helix region